MPTMRECIMLIILVTVPILLMGMFWGGQRQ